MVKLEILIIIVGIFTSVITEDGIIFGLLQRELGSRMKFMESARPLKNTNIKIRPAIYRVSDKHAFKNICMVKSMVEALSTSNQITMSLNI